MILVKLLVSAVMSALFLYGSVQLTEEVFTRRVVLLEKMIEEEHPVSSNFGELPLIGPYAPYRLSNKPDDFFSNTTLLALVPVVNEVREAINLYCYQHWLKNTMLGMNVKRVCPFAIVAYALIYYVGFALFFYKLLGSFHKSKKSYPKSKVAVKSSSLVD